jgi:hypothetical protein
MTQDTLNAIKIAAANFKPTQKDASRIFSKIEEEEKAYQKQVKASIPTQKDRQRVFGL